MLHIMMYTDNLAMTYHHSFAIHYFIQAEQEISESNLDLLLRRGLELLDEHVPYWREAEEKRELNYLGIEYLPININDEYLIIAEFDTKRNGDAHVVLKRMYTIKPLPSTVIEHIKMYREQYLTVDMDGEYYLNKVLMSIVNDTDAVIDLHACRIFKTFRGYHIRYKLPKPTRIDHLIDLRERLGDDYQRIQIDRLYINNGYDYLTNILFNAKYFYDLGHGKYEFYEEQEMKITDFKIAYKFQLGYEVSDKIDVMYKGCRITAEESELKVHGLITEEEARMLKGEVEEKYLKEDKVRAVILRNIANLNIFNQWLVGKIITKRILTFDFKRNTVTVKMHPKYLPYIGRMIGKKGANVKKIEAELGMKVRIFVDESEEDKALRLSLLMGISNEDWGLLYRTGGTHPHIFYRDEAKEIMQRLFGTSQLKPVSDSMLPTEIPRLIAVPYNDKVIMLNPVYKTLFIAKDEDIKEYRLYF